MPTLSNEEALEVLQRLIDRTKTGKLTWIAIEIGDQLQAATSPFQYYVGSRDSDGEAPYFLEIWKAIGDQENVKVDEMWTTVDAPFNALLRTLFNLAQADWLGITNLKDDILRALGE